MNEEMQCLKLLALNVIRQSFEDWVKILRFSPKTADEFKQKQKALEEERKFICSEWCEDLCKMTGMFSHSALIRRYEEIEDKFINKEKANV